MISEANYSGDPAPDVGGETEFYRCNFAQPAPVDSGGGVMVGVRLWPGDDTPRTFTNCNLTNCEPPPGSTVASCLTVLQSYRLPGDIDTATIDGVPIELQHRLNRVYGRWTSTGYDYLPTPMDIDAGSDGG